MVQVDLPGAFAAGQLCGILSKSYLLRERRLFCQPLMGPVALYLALGFAPVGLFLLVCWPAWEGMYWWEWVERPSANPAVALFYVGFLLALVLVGVLSFVLSHRLFLAGRGQLVTVLAVVGVLLAVAPFFVWPMTWYWVGSQAEYHAVPRQSAPLFEAPTFLYSWAMVLGYFVLVSAAFGFWLKKAASALTPEG